MLEKIFSMLKFCFEYNIFVIIVLIIYAIFNKKREDKKLQMVDFLLMVVLVIYAGIRYNVGTDYLRYYQRYNTINTNLVGWEYIISRSNEVGFNFLAYATKLFWGYEYGLFWIVSIAIYPLTVILIRKKSKNAFLSVASYFLLGFHLMTLNILRQGIAMVIIFAAGNYLFEKKYKQFVILTLLATTFHITALIAGILLFISTKLKVNIKTLFLLFLGGVIVYYNFDIIFKSIPFLGKYESYIKNTDFINYYRMIISVTFFLLLYTLIAIIGIINKEKLQKIDPKAKYYIRAIIIGIPINIIAIKSWPMYRISFYLYQFVILLIPLIPLIGNKEKNKKTIQILLLIAMFCWNIFFVVANNDNASGEYKTYINNKE